MPAQLTLLSVVLLVFAVVYGKPDNTLHDGGPGVPMTSYLNEDPVIVDYPQESDMLMNMEKRWANKVRFGKRASWASSVRFG
ncbi:unnamed protein product [Caenorhabditis auriculariae]|uniref:Uncharacterized protein n=1 Tax=Caenorhabditis auriculariae TaxID=2777116 RepID=A0A8S1H021_9PELO|nr:unnamed protein product [Caenorhabditis auriculariae]